MYKTIKNEFVMTADAVEKKRGSVNKGAKNVI